MKKWMISIGAVLLLAGASVIFVNNVNLEVQATSRGTIPVFTPTISASPSSGEKVNLLSGRVYEVAANYEKYITSQYFESGDAFVPSEDLYQPDDVKVSWKSDAGASYYTVKIGTEKTLSNAQEYVTMDNSLAISDLYAGTHYYYRVIATFEDRTVKSRIFDFETASLPRTISIDGVSNTRDIGGYITEDGKHRVRQGLVYRGAKMDDITQEGRKKALGIYGIKTDLDLRKDDEGMNVSPLGSDINYIKVSGPYYTGSNGIENPNYKDALLTEIRTFTKKENYPIYVHCSLGKDRTGTICFLINALCGVTENDLYRDYELSYLSAMGSSDKNALPNTSVYTFTGMYNYIKYYMTGETMAEKTENFMLSLGVTKQEITSIRSIMLEEVK